MVIWCLGQTQAQMGRDGQLTRIGELAELENSSIL